MGNWAQIDFSSIDTPALVIDKESVKFNIRQAIHYAGEAGRLRPHVKTHKTLEVAQLQIEAGISKFKCATIAEAEMLGIAGAKDVLIAYQPQTPKEKRVLTLIDTFPNTNFSVLIDNTATAKALNDFFRDNNKSLAVYIDINVGQNRTGVLPSAVAPLVKNCKQFHFIDIMGIHCYDGHIHMTSFEERKAACKQAFKPIDSLKLNLEQILGKPLVLIAGGSPSFLIHAAKQGIECSPGTFIFWDEGYASKFAEQEFKKAAFIATRVISKIDQHTYCLDLGHKSIASEFPLPRIKFIGNDQLGQIGHSEEHLVVKSVNPDQLNIGDLLLAFPLHICPTVALYDSMHVISNGEIEEQWKIIARNRKISI